MNLPPFPDSVIPASPEERLRLIQYGAECARAELERCAAIADDESRIRSQAAMTHPEDSASRDRCFAGARAATNVGRGIRSGEIVGAECARAYKDDAERLNWLEAAWRDGVHAEVCAKGEGTTWHAMAPSASVFVGPQTFTGDTLRAAIDAASESAIPAKDGQECPELRNARQTGITPRESCEGDGE